MKIAILAPVTLQDFEQYIGEPLPSGLYFSALTPIVFEFLGKGDEVVLVTLSNDISKSVIFHKGNLTIFVGVYRTISKLRALDLFLYEKYQMVNYLKTNPCDIYHAHWSYEFAQAALCIDANRTVITLHDWAPEIYKTIPDFYRKRRLKMNNEVLKKGINFTAVSPYIENLLRTNVHKTADIIPNCIEIPKNEWLLEKERSEIFTIICVNNGFTDLKNVKTSLLVFEKFVRKYYRSQMVLYGQGFEMGGDCYKWCIKNGISTDHIFFGGKIDHVDVCREIRHADVLLHLSKEESFGLVIAEAMLTGTPVIGGDNSGAVPWLLDYGQAGIIVNVMDIEGTFDALEKLYSSASFWKEKSVKGMTYISKLVDKKNIASLYLKKYESIIQINK